MAEHCLILEHLAGRGRKHTIPMEGGAIGRDAHCLVVVSDPKAEDYHCQIGWEPEGWFIRDCVSNSGTFVNGAAIRKQRLKEGDVITFANQRLKVLRLEEPSLNSQLKMGVELPPSAVAAAQAREVVQVSLDHESGWQPASPPVGQAVSLPTQAGQPAPQGETAQLPDAQPEAWPVQDVQVSEVPVVSSTAELRIPDVAQPKSPVPDVAAEPPAAESSPAPAGGDAGVPTAEAAPVAPPASASQESTGRIVIAGASSSVEPPPSAATPPQVAPATPSPRGRGQGEGVAQASPPAVTGLRTAPTRRRKLLRAVASIAAAVLLVVGVVMMRRGGSEVPPEASGTQPKDVLPEGANLQPETKAVTPEQQLAAAEKAFDEARFKEAIPLFDAALRGMAEDQATDRTVLELRRSKAQKCRALCQFALDRAALTFEAQVQLLVRA